MILNIFFCIVSLLLVILAPNQYSYGFCLILHWLYIGVFLHGLYRHRKEGYVNYIFIFSIAYYFVNFVYPVFYFPYNPYFSLFLYAFDEKLIPYCTAVAFCAYSFLLLGMTPRNIGKGIIVNRNKKGKNVSKSVLRLPIKVHEYLIRSLFKIFIIVLLIFLSTGGLFYFTHQFSGQSNESDIESGYIFSLLQAVVYPLWVLVLLYPRRTTNLFRVAFLTLIGFILIILLTGSRTLPIALIIIGAGIYNDYVKRVRLSVILAGAIVGAILMTLVGALRGSGELINSDSINASQSILSEKDSIFDFANGLIINNRSLYSLIGYAEKYTYTYGLTLISAIFNVIPFMVTAFSNATGIHIDFLGSATFNTFLESGHYRHQGLGTNAVSDIYLAFGLIGVIIVFYLFGRIIQWLKNNTNKSIYYCMAYYILLSGAIFTCRSTILGNLKPILWSIFIVWCLIKISPKSHKLLLKNHDEQP